MLIKNDSSVHVRQCLSLDIPNPISCLANLVEKCGKRISATFHNEEQKKALAVRHYAYTHPGEPVTTNHIFPYQTSNLQDCGIYSIEDSLKNLYERIDGFSEQGEKVFLNFDNRQCTLFIAQNKGASTC